ncbi:MAG TPA: TIGR03960 family B12-binding radical SAM protein [Desulfomonilaceae bacterium]|nr:TIGR03960 family B12-binding radical SAM protein [Desulfomonilaceae bacterium]
MSVRIMIVSSVSDDPHGKSDHSASTEELLCRVQKPARYTGREINSVIKDPSTVKMHMALCFPDVYEVGMSHLGLKILYSIVNDRPDLYAERAFAPWWDMETAMRSEHVPLTTLETGTPLSRCDLVGFSLQYELCATTVLQMLDLAHIPLRWSDRSTRDPFVVGGGPVAFNPVPLAAFFDAFVIGDGEEAILELADALVRWKRYGGSRNDLLEEWKLIPGVYVPPLHKAGEKVTKRIIADLSKQGFPSSLVVPFCEIVHDRIGIEIARGCTRGCRFCQAGMLYRPVREREPEAILNVAKQNIATAGWEEVALLSLSSGDYSLIGSLVGSMANDFSGEKVAISLPSLRTDTFDPEIAKQIRRIRKTGFTLAPEAGTQRLRRIINKGNTEEDLEKAVRAAFKNGWQSLKLYFMIGLPLETQEDLDGIVGLILRASKWSKGGKITASVSTFVPKSHTPFQWAAQIDMDETAARQHYIKRYFHKGRARVKFHNARVSFLEGVLARGDARLSDVIESTFKKGARFDGWDEHLKFDSWMEAFSETGVDPHPYLNARMIEDALPWNFIDPGISPEYLASEWHKAQSEESTSDCRLHGCTSCGVCDFKDIKPILVSDGTLPLPDLADTEPCHEDSVRRFRLKYAKLNRMRFIGHQDVIRLFQRAFRRAGLRLEYSHGFHPHPKLRFSPPLALGVESTAEYVDFDLLNVSLPLEEVERLMGERLPDGIKPLNFEEISLNDSAVSGKIQQVIYEVTFCSAMSPENVRQRIRTFESAESVEVVKMHKGRSKSRDLKACISTVEFSGCTLTMTINSGPSGSIHPVDAVAALMGISREDAGSLKIVKTAVAFQE